MAKPVDIAEKILKLAVERKDWEITTEATLLLAKLNHSIGRPTKMSPAKIRHAIARVNSGETVTEVAEDYGVHRVTLSRLINRRPY